VYIFRDVLPLATFTCVPEDLDEGPLLWVHIALLFSTGVVIPIFTPRQYIPVDPLVSSVYIKASFDAHELKNPMETPNPEMTASIFSFAFYFFLDRIIFLAHRESQLHEEELYPLCDSDSATHLKAESFQAGIFVYNVLILL
jgi:hypothetical protein